MQHRFPFAPVRLLLLLFLVSGGYYTVRALPRNGDSALTASGSIEATRVNVSPEMAGKVKEVLAEEGQPVKKGDVLLMLDESLLAAQRQVAQSGVDAARSALLTAQSAYDLARAQYEATLTAARAQEGSQRLSDWSKRTPNWFEQPLWYFSKDEQIAAAQTEVEASHQGLQQAQADVESVIKNLNNADFIAAEIRLSNARMSYITARTVRDHAQMTGGKVRPEDVQADISPLAPSTYRVKIAIAHDLSGESDIVSAANDVFDLAEAELNEAEKAYKDLLTTEAAQRIRKARATLSVAQERYEAGLDTLNRLETGEYSPQVKIASMALEQSKTALKQAESAVEQAESNLTLVDTQMAKLTIYAPMDGVILTRSAEVGQTALPGATLIEIGRLDQLKLTVYLPEEKFGLIVPGQAVQVRVDAYRDRVFEGTVLHMANEAEFTPTNVQTKEDRTRLVYAVVVRLNNPNLELKPGMIADVDFGLRESK